MAGCAVEIIEKNGYSNVIKVVPKRSTNITVGPGMLLYFDENKNILQRRARLTKCRGDWG